ncbi:hypothetical protein EDB92DRAFT_1951507 [Lactarius akahatsu]|uniref:Uncharacterized protein n=1 Tax=Lactarius akahatsu TaxID=416441 RepID=A0AAD4L9U4_9AGAM|nr:hypothetical protein EDB92DRAFT_1951507 [Lactarius akahatsu]
MRVRRLCRHVERGNVIRTLQPDHAENDDAWQTTTNKTTPTIPGLRLSSMRHANYVPPFHPAASLVDTTRRPRLSFPQASIRSQTPLTILPEPARTEIAIPPRALSRLHSSNPPDPVRKVQEMQQHAIRQGFFYAAGAHGLLASLPAAEPTPASDSSTCATITNSTTASGPDPDPDLQDASLDLASTSTSLWTSGMRPRKMKTQIRIWSSSATSFPLNFRPRCCARRVPMATQTLGLVIPEPDANFDLASPSPNRAGEGWIDWLVRVLVQIRALASTLLGDDASSLVRGFGGVLPSRATDDNEEEEEVMGTGDDDSPAPLESIAAAAGSRMRMKNWRKALADEVEVRHNDDNNDESDYGGGPRTHVISAPAFTDACRKKRTPASSSLGGQDTPTQDALYADQGVDGQVMP